MESPSTTQQQAFDRFRTVAGAPAVDDATILALVETEGKDAIRAAVDKNARAELRRMLYAHLARRSIVLLGHNSLSPDHVRQAVKTVGLGVYQQALAAGDAPSKARLAQWLAAAAVEAAPTHPSTTPLPPIDGSIPGVTNSAPAAAAPPPAPAAPTPTPRPAYKPAPPPAGAYVAGSVRTRAAEAAPTSQAAPAASSSSVEGYDRYAARDDARQAQASAMVPRAAAPPREYDEVKVFGKDVGLSIQRKPLKPKRRDGDDAQQPPATLDGPTTINFRIAKAKPNSRALDGLLWEGATEVMLMQQELQLCLGVLLGYLPKYRAAGHGELHDKWFELEENKDAQYAGAVRVTIVQGKDDDKDVRRISIGWTDIGAAAAIFFRAAQSRLRLSGHELVATIRRTCEMWAKSPDGRKILEGGNAAPTNGAGQGGRAAKAAPH